MDAKLRAIALLFGASSLGCTATVEGGTPADPGSGGTSAAGATGGSAGMTAASGAGGSGATGGTGAAPGSGGSGVGGSGTGGGPAGSGGSAGVPIAPAAFSPAPSRLRRLTSFEYENSVLDLLGPGTVVTVELEKDAAYNNLTSLAASSIALSAPLTEQLEASAYALAGSLVNDTARRQALVGCAPVGNADPACLRTFVRTFGRSAFRRPLTNEEVELYAAVGDAAAAALGTFWGSVEYTLAAMLQSPSFFYRTEFGIADLAEAARRNLDGYEIATRLSYYLWSTTPDRQLLDAAEAGTLATPEGLTAEMDRLLASPRAALAVTRVLSEMLRLGELDLLVQSPTLFPAVASPTLGASMRAETEAVLGDLVFTRNGDYRELFTSTRTFLNGELASLYGVTGPNGTGLVAHDLPLDGPRAGYLGQGSFLALNAHADSTSPTFRGKFIVETLLCEGIEPAPMDVVAELPEKDKSKTLREQLVVHQSDPTCAGCHAMMDPLGLALEHFDAIGAYRETDRGMPLDVTGTLADIPFDGARALGTLLTSQPTTDGGIPKVADCLVRNLYRAATGHLELAGEQSLIAAQSADFAVNGFAVQRALRTIVTSEAFRIVGLPE